MPLASYILSLCLHVAVILAIWLLPSIQPPVDLSKPVLISLVEGDPGGNKTPSPILGPMGEKGGEEMAPSPPAERAESAATAREESKAAPEAEPKVAPLPKEEPKKPELQPVPKPEPKPVPKPEVKKEPPKPKPEPKKEEPKKKDEPKQKEEAKKPAVDPVKAAIDQAKRKASSRAESGDRGSSVEKALAEARRKAGGNRGGGGGEGSGPGGGGMYSVYIGQVMLAVRPNWGYASGSRQNLQCTITIEVSESGEVLKTKVERSSGNVQYDASCVNAIMRTSRAGDFPPPPTPEYQKLEMVFTLNELRGG